MIRKLSATVSAALILGAAAVLLAAGPASAEHRHFVHTPNGGCHEVASGQTGIADPAHGGYHRYHVNVHWGATDDDHVVLGNGNSRVEIRLDC